ncbi:metalloendopeptidase-like membrane protein [Mycobacteroides abscessus subsp. abscessus]|uniref:Metalloendopeptidase-like membrane protein n=1 Tax=Mycobacteroides abscessus subsp. abscessus TaxID=1185650 RepID=A0AB38D0D9_9MYCO|nr:N-acetylmuramoyl-L-alanine amidase [Mycobacteroides abscessus]SHX06853.1 metalloendopeptidase-like membrane protein [Mycobacteroides abscessus subsp. abscessus]SIA11141.1 metalloendopeptidase-like membrane protein [Mycobacteroides abscessus subsp. abscessus]SIB13637.1 metalloendopeptidase-like membrane protein [Mycobacteroides abscessus subsp. abscessus]SIB15020.1 metalloendopeptidase-like membrane protein [Mycobacteroides abscessus subsp. abscessus]SIB17310.1 metalloendopeptidase-like memb
MYYTKDDIARVIIQVGQQMGITSRGIHIALATGWVESKFVFYANSNYPESLDKRFKYDAVGSDGMSVNYMQQQNFAEWGSLDERMDLYAPARMFFDHLANPTKYGIKAFDYNDPTLTPGQCAQKVQRSAFPDRYDQAMGVAVEYFNRLTTGIVLPPRFFEEINIIGEWAPNWQSRNGRKPRLFVLHTSEGAAGMDLVDYMAGASVSYHYLVNPDGKTWDLVDTDDASWSVLDANNYTINLVFGGSRAAMSRVEWLEKYDKAIRVAAYLAVQDCLKYGIPVQLLVGNKYSQLPTTDGITDHNGITVGLGIGSHTDVGPNFPWDVFNNYLLEFSAQAGEDDMFNDDDRLKLNRVYFELTNRWESRSIYRTPGEGPVDTLAGMLLNDDGMEHAELIERLAVLGDEDSLQRVIRTAAGEGAVADKGNVARAKKVLATVPKEILEAYKEAAK